MKKKVEVRIENPQLLRTVMDGMRDRFALAIQRAVEREMRDMFKPLRKAQRRRRTGKRKRTR
jgi:hypothetical protein